MRIRTALVISVALVTFLFVGLGITKQADGPESIEMALTARPLIWIDEDRILVGKDNVIYLYDVGDKTSKSLYKVLGEEITTKFEWSCFTEHNWALFVIAGPRTPPNNALVVKWTEPQVFSEETIGITAEINPIDCRSQMRRLPPESMTEGGKEWTSVRPIRFAERFKVHSDVADQIALYKSGDELLAAAFKANEVKSIQLGKRLAHYDRAIASAYDRQTDRYLWYTPSSNFNSKYMDWPLQAWWVGRDLSVDSSIELPAGPWGWGIRSLQDVQLLFLWL